MFRIILNRVFKTFLVGSLILLFVGGILFATGYGIYHYYLLAPLAITKELRYTLPTHSNLSQVAQELMQQELLNYPSALTWVILARVQNKAHKIRAGEYAIPVGTTPQALLEIFIEGKTIQYELTLVEGWNFHQIMSAIHAHPHLIHTLVGLDDAAIMAKLGWPHQHPEGRFFPDTYLFPTGTSDVTCLQRAYHKMTLELNAAWEKRRKNVPLKTPYDALILASIVEKETAVPNERPLIAGVFLQRLQKNMLLQTDPTVIYALGTHYDGNIRKQDLKIDNPYNTYVNPGLPPTPIAMPGRAALQATLNPNDTQALYFVAKGDGSHYFSASYAEHQCAIIEYQLKNELPGRCKQYLNLNKKEENKS